MWALVVYLVVNLCFGTSLLSDTTDRKERAFVFGVYIQESNDAHMNDGHQVFTLLIA